MSAKTMRQPPFVRLMVISFLVIWLIVAAFPFLWTLWGTSSRRPIGPMP